MNNITKWLKSITQEQFRDFFMIRGYDCDNCPANDFCITEQDCKYCEETFYQWAIKQENDKITDIVHKEAIRKLVDMISNDVVDKLLKEENNE